MTSLLPPSTRRPDRAGLPGAGAGPDPATRRPLALVAAAGGLLAAGGVLLVCAALGVVGWFLTDAGSHGTPTGGMRVGALGWLVAHGSQVTVDGVRLTALPLGLTLVCAWTVWRVGLRVGESVSGHGPDADRIDDGERDWTVPGALAFFSLGYGFVVVLAAALAATPAEAPATGRAVLGGLLLCLAVGAPALAVGSGRASIWLAAVPPLVRAVLTSARAVLVWWCWAALLLLLGALVVDVSTAANVMSQLHTSAGDVALLALAGALVLPNAAVCSGAYLLGPGFSVGTGTLVSPSAVVLGPLPMFPLLAALPDGGPTPGWAPWLVGVPLLLAVAAAARAHRAHPTRRWEEGALHGGAGGVLAGLGVGLLAALAGGAVGPGRMAEVGPFVGPVLVHAVTAFGIGGLLGGLLATWLHRRRTDAEDAEDAGDAEPSTTP